MNRMHAHALSRQLPICDVRLARTATAIIVCNLSCAVKQQNDGTTQLLKDRSQHRATTSKYNIPANITHAGSRRSFREITPDRNRGENRPGRNQSHLPVGQLG